MVEGGVCLSRQRPLSQRINSRWRNDAEGHEPPRRSLAAVTGLHPIPAAPSCRRCSTITLPVASIRPRRWWRRRKPSCRKPHCCGRCSMSATSRRRHRRRQPRTPKAKMCDGGHFVPSSPAIFWRYDSTPGGRHDCSCEKDRHAARPMV